MKSIPKVRTAVFPVGGMGTRFLPITKSIPKEMLPIIDKPLIQYAVEEALAAGIEHFVFVTGRGKNAIEDYFDHSFELEQFLKAKAKELMLSQVTASVFKPGQVAYTRQQQPLGLGHAVWCARHLVGDEPFALLLADDLMVGEVPCLQQLMNVYHKVGGQVIAAMEVPRDQLSRYGVLKVKKQTKQLLQLSGMVEKPSADKAPSNFAITGRYILPPEIFAVLEKAKPSVGGEIQLTDAMVQLMKKIPAHGYVVNSQRFDCGNKLGFLQAQVAMAKHHPELKDHVASIVGATTQTKRTH